MARVVGVDPQAHPPQIEHVSRPARTEVVQRGAACRACGDQVFQRPAFAPGDGNDDRGGVIGLDAKSRPAPR